MKIKVVNGKANANGNVKTSKSQGFQLRTPQRIERHKCTVVEPSRGQHIRLHEKKILYCNLYAISSLLASKISRLRNKYNVHPLIKKLSIRHEILKMVVEQLLITNGVPKELSFLLPKASPESRQYLWTFYCPIFQQFTKDTLYKGDKSYSVLLL